MAKQAKAWRVRPDFEGRVTFETECKHVVLSNTLSQEQLAEIAQLPAAAVFMELAPQPAQTDGN